MTDRARVWLIGVLAGIVVATAVLVAGFWLGGAFDPSHRTDGSFVLDEPGVFQEPLDGINADASGTSLPDVALLDADEVEHDLAELTGSPTVINFWFSRCIPCRRELSDFAAVHAEVGDRIRFVGVNPYDTVSAMQQFADERDVAYDLWRDPDQELVDEVGIIGFPVTMLVAADGTVLRQTGEIDADTLRATIDELFPRGA